MNRAQRRAKASQSGPGIADRNAAVRQSAAGAVAVAMAEADLRARTRRAVTTIANLLGDKCPCLPIDGFDDPMVWQPNPACEPHLLCKFSTAPDAHDRVIESVERALGHRLP